MLVDPWTYILWSLLLLTIPSDWLISAMGAAIVHEASHLAMIYVLGGTVKEIRIHMGGAEIQTGPLDVWQELLCTLAGPIGSFSLVLLCRYHAKLAICGFAQGCFNLIPLYPLDGGRALRCCLEILMPNRKQKTEILINRIVFLILIFAMAIFGWYFRVTTVMVMVLAVTAIRFLIRKKPCKQVGFHVQ